MLWIVNWYNCYLIEFLNCWYVHHIDPFSYTELSLHLRNKSILVYNICSTCSWVWLASILLKIHKRWTLSLFFVSGLFKGRTLHITIIYSFTFAVGKFENRLKLLPKVFCGIPIWTHHIQSFSSFENFVVVIITIIQCLYKLKAI